jgi:hypothetical protein
MGTSLNGLTPAATYQGLIKFGDNSIIGATLRYLSDGAGNDLPISVALASVGINTLTGSALVNIKGTGTTSSSSPFTITNSAGTNSMQVLDNTNTIMGNAIKVGAGGGIFGTSGYVTMINGGNSSWIGPETFFSNAGSWTANILGAPLFTLSGSGYASINGNTGIGVTPTSRLQVKGSGSTSATTSLLVQNSSSTQLLKVTDDGVIEAGSATATQFKVMNTEGLAISRDASLDANIRIREFTGGGPVIKLNGNSTPTFKFIDSSNFQCILSHATWTGIGKGVTENTSAALQVESTTKGFLPPKMTTTQKNAITTPAAGLVVYDSTTNKLCCYNGSTWNDLF